MYNRKLESYEKICPNCNGSGFGIGFWTCSICKGSGKINWIDIIKLDKNKLKNINGMWDKRIYKNVKKI